MGSLFGEAGALYFAILAGGVVFTLMGWRVVP
jgi:hypothetical protein